MTKKEIINHNLATAEIKIDTLKIYNNHGDKDLFIEQYINEIEKLIKLARYTNNTKIEQIEIDFKE